MTVNKYVKIAFWLTLAGTAFSGYLSGVKFFGGTCAFGEACPVFLGYPACYYGFTLFASMFIATSVALAYKVGEKWPLKFNTIFAALGILFSGYFVVVEVIGWIQHGFDPKFFGLSTCAYGLLFFAAIFVFTLVSFKKLTAPLAPAPAPQA